MSIPYRVVPTPSEAPRALPDAQEDGPELIATTAELLAAESAGIGMAASAGVVAQLVEVLKPILHPAYTREGPLVPGAWPGQLRQLVAEAYGLLAAEIQRVQRVLDPTSASRSGAEVAGRFLRRIPTIRRHFLEDVEAAYEGDPAATSREEVVACYPGVEAVGIHRLAHALYELGVPLLPRMMSEYAHSKTGADIHPAARIGRRFFIDHATGVVIGETTQIGDGVKLYQGVTLGATGIPSKETAARAPGRKRHPTIGDDVVIYANATILGGTTTVLHHSVIGSNVWLRESVGPHVIVSLAKPSVHVRPIRAREE